METAAQIAENVARVRERIAVAAARVGRSPGEITLVAVTKYFGLDEARALVAAGCSDLGESRPQALWQKAESLADVAVRWHLIGHLQRNKVARSVAAADLIHSVDSARLLAEIDKEGAAIGRRVRGAENAPRPSGQKPTARRPPRSPLNGNERRLRASD